MSYNAVMSLGGRNVELVRDAPAGSDPETDTEIYRAQTDDGTRVERRTGGTNGDDNGEYWIVTTTDGTKYYFGLNEVGGGHADANSVSTVPVFGNHPGEPCHATAFADSRCGAGKQQAWRWGLDKVVDVHGNVMVVNWKQETNHYAVRKKFTSPEQYERAAYPTTIEYGMRSSDLTKPSATVEFGVKQRCLKSETACDAANFAKTDDPGAYRPWWDTPGNLNCKSTSKLCPAFPSFWTQMRLDTVTTKAARAGQHGPGQGRHLPDPPVLPGGLVRHRPGPVAELNHPARLRPRGQHRHPSAQGRRQLRRVLGRSHLAPARAAEGPPASQPGAQRPERPASRVHAAPHRHGGHRVRR
ncbi:hypothetical protein STENM223S_08413 [Streptomyces tendae]